MSNEFAITVIRNRILYFFNKTDEFIRALVELTGEDAYPAHHVRHPFQREPYFEIAFICYDFPKLPARAVKLVKHGPTCVGRK